MADVGILVKAQACIERQPAREALTEYMEALGIGRGYQKETTDSTDAEFSGNPRFEELKAARNEYYQTIDAINDINDQLSSKQRDLTEAERVELYDERRDLEQHARELDEWIKYVQASMRSRKSKTDDDFANQREAYNPRIVEGGDAPAPTDEDIPQQLIGQLSIDHCAGLKKFVQAVIPGKNDERAHLFPAHSLAGLHRLLDHRHHLLINLFRAEKLFQFHIAQMIDHTAQLRLEQHHKGNKAYRKHLTEDEIQGMQL